MRAQIISTDWILLNPQWWPAACQQEGGREREREGGKEGERKTQASKPVEPWPKPTPLSQWEKRHHHSISVCSCHYNKTLQMEWHLFLTVLEARILSQGISLCGASWDLSPWLANIFLLTVSSHDPLCEHKPPSYKDISSTEWEFRLYGLN
jgi:hypothetical protein